MSNVLVKTIQKTNIARVLIIEIMTFVIVPYMLKMNASNSI